MPALVNESIEAIHSPVLASRAVSSIRFATSWEFSKSTSRTHRGQRGPEAR